MAGTTAAPLMVEDTAYSADATGWPSTWASYASYAGNGSAVNATPAMGQPGPFGPAGPFSLPPEEVMIIIDGFKARQFVYTEASHIALIACYVPLFLVALFANCLVIFVVFKYHYMRSVTNYFLVNLSFADLLVTLICMPMAVGQNVTKLWIYGEVMCMLTTYFQGVSVSASIFTITAMSIDRYLAIRHPMAFRKVFNRKSTIIVIVALWLVSTLLFAPLLWVLQTQPVDLGGQLAEAVETNGLKFCVENWTGPGFSKKVYGAFLFTLVYAIPGTVVMAAYSLMGRRLCAVKPPFDENSTAGSASSQQGSRLVRERRRVARILLVLAVLFAMCWLPYNVMMLAMDLLDLEVDTQQWLLSLLPFTLLLGHCNSAINPLLYCFMTRNFRRTVRGLFARRRPRALGSRPQQRCKVPDSSLPSNSQRHLLERLRFVSQPSQAVLRAKAAHIARQSSRGPHPQRPPRSSRPSVGSGVGPVGPGPLLGHQHSAHAVGAQQLHWQDGQQLQQHGAALPVSSGLGGPSGPNGCGRHHLAESAEVEGATAGDHSVSSLAAPESDALEMHHLRVHSQTNGSLSGVQSHEAA